MVCCITSFAEHELIWISRSSTSLIDPARRACPGTPMKKIWRKNPSFQAAAVILLATSFA
nr:hypothetical protein Iba_chr04dCG11170 [Ipomoea batatas]GMC89189.1 hypothetical protein Iba_chr04eCG17130 [Ipomoea batatas]